MPSWYDTHTQAEHTAPLPHEKYVLARLSPRTHRILRMASRGFGNATIYGGPELNGIFKSYSYEPVTGNLSHEKAMRVLTYLIAVECGKIGRGDIPDDIEQLITGDIDIENR